MVSLIVAMVVLVLTLSWSVGGTTVYAASMDPDSITTFDGDNSEGGVTRAAEDSTNGLTISYNNDGGSLSAPVKMLLVLTILSLAPSILIMLTSYTRIIIVLHFLRTAIGTQTAPPNQVLIALALFLTFFIMWPTFQQINTEAIQPLDKGEIIIFSLEDFLNIFRDHRIRYGRTDQGIHVRSDAGKRFKAVCGYFR